MCLGKSLILIIKSRGPKTNPCGTPCLTISQVEGYFEHYLHCCQQFHKYWYIRNGKQLFYMRHGDVKIYHSVHTHDDDDDHHHHHHHSWYKMVKLPHA